MKKLVIKSGTTLVITTLVKLQSTLADWAENLLSWETKKCSEVILSCLSCKRR